MNDDRLRRISQTYDEHPQTATAILKRLGSGSDLAARPPTALDLAIDPAGGVTDQNHATGAEGVFNLGRDLGLKPGSRVLDIGAGLGGPARLLVHSFGAEVVGVELTQGRHRDAVELTRLVGLGDRVRFIRGDALELDLSAEGEAEGFDVAVFFDSLSHFPDKAAILRTVLAACRPGGRVAIEDCLLRRPPLPDERADLAELSNHWNATIPEHEAWLVGSGPTVRVERHLPLHREYRGQLDLMIARADEPGADPVVYRELRAWRIARSFVDSGLLGYARIILAPPELTNKWSKSA